MKFFSFISLFLVISNTVFPQVGIGNTDPQASLDIRSSNQASPSNTDGILIPKADNFPATNPGVSQDGMMLYITGSGTQARGFYFWDNTNVKWSAIDGVIERIGNSTTFGWRLKDVAAANYGSLGNRAVDLSVQPNNFSRGATGSYSFASGQSTLASGNSSFAINSHARATGNASFASGINTQAVGQYSAAFGYYSTALEYTSFAFGDLSTAQGRSSFAGGIHNRAGTYGQTSLGTYSTYVSGNAIVFTPTDRLFVLGNGTSNSSRSDALVILKNGVITAPSFDITEITDNKALVTKEYADINYNDGGSLDYLDDGNGFGWRLKDVTSANYGLLGDGALDLSFQTTTNNGGATNRYALALGYNTLASGEFSTALGISCEASGINSFAFGNNTIASAQNTTAFGVSAQATSIYATAFGLNTQASGVRSTAFGDGTVASGNASIAFGYNAQASGNYATAFGNVTTALGGASTAFGNSTQALGASSTAIGYNNTAESLAQISLGINSTVSVGNANIFIPTDRLLVLGNGDAVGNTSDALVVLKNGTITAPSFDISEITDNKALVTKEYADANYSVDVVEASIVATLNPSWSWYSALYKEPAYYKHNDRVYLEGLLRKTGTYVSGEVIFTLPVGYRPSARIIVHGGQGTNTARLDVLANGDVIYNTGATADYISLESISFRAN